MATLHSSSPGPAVRPNFPPGNFTLFQRIFGVISVNTHGELLKLMQMKLKSVKNTTQMTLQSYVATAYMLSYIQQKSVEFYYVLQATSKTAPTDLNRKMFFFKNRMVGSSSQVKWCLQTKYQPLTRNLKICDGHPNRISVSISLLSVTQFRLSVDGVCWMLFCERIENINIS